MSAFAIEDDDLLDGLAQLFRGRCAFCESATDVSPYRFRPTEEAGPTKNVAEEFAHRSHLYYTWLVNDWANIYPICDGCRPIEESVFPIRTGYRMPLPTRDQIERYDRNPSGLWPFPSEEKQLFLDPCGDENFRLNLVVVPDGRLFGLSARGEATIQHFNLDRAGLTERRRITFASYLEQLFAMSDDPDVMPFRFDEMEFGGTWYLLLHQLARRIASGVSGTPKLSPNAIRDFYAQRMGSANFEKQLGDTLQSFDESPETLLRPVKRPRVVMRGKARPIWFRIENFKSIGTLELELMPDQATDRSASGLGSMAAEVARMESRETLAPALMILGENAVGKSSILEAIALSLAGEAAWTDLDLPPTSLMLDPGLLGGKGKLRTARISVGFEDRSQLEIRVDRSGEIGVGDDENRIPVFAYGAFRMFAEGAGKAQPASNVVSIFRPEHVLPNPEGWLVRIAEKPLFSEVRRALNQILAIDGEIDGIAVEKGRCVLSTSMKGPDGKRITTKTPLGLVSSGFRSVLSMACHVIRGLVEIQDAGSASIANTRAVVLIDEVEAHLHPRWKMRVIRGLREALPSVTFIMTTHDPLCLRNLSPGELLVLRRTYGDGGDSVPSVIESIDDLPPVSAMSVEQLLTSDFFDLFSTDDAGTEMTLARAGDLLASSIYDAELAESAGFVAMRRAIGAQVAKALPIGSTEIERLIQEAVEQYLRDRASARGRTQGQLREKTRRKIVDLLKRY